MSKNTKQFSVAVTGTSSIIGHNLILKLLQDSSVKKIVALDKDKPRIKNKKISFKKVDITRSISVDEISNTLKKAGCKTIVHAALPNRPTPDRGQMHELQSIGSVNILLVAESAGINKLILTSTTEVYGATPKNPSYLCEEHALRGYTHSTFLRDKIDVEKQFMKFQKRFPKKIVTILRPCTILSKEAKNFMANFLAQPIVPTVLGFDPLVQFVHIKDVISAIDLAIKKSRPGIFNIVGDGVLPLSRALTMLSKTNMPLPEIVLTVSTQLLWYLGISVAPYGHINFLKYQFVADGTKAKKIMKFEPTYSSKEAVLSVKPAENCQKKSFPRTKKSFPRTRESSYFGGSSGQARG